MAAPMTRRCVRLCRTLPSGCRSYTSASRSANAVRVQKESANLPFWNFIEKRRAEASRSILFAIPCRERYHDLMSACRAHGELSRCFYYSSPSKHFALVEFGNLQFTHSFMHCIKPFPSDPKSLQVPTRTRMVFMADGRTRRTNRNASSGQSCPIEEEPSAILTADDLSSYDSISDEILAIYQSHRQTELSTRLRFFICSILEEALCGAFLPYARVQPFGSSVSGLGKRDTDLDMNLLLHEPPSNSKSAAKDSGAIFRYMTKVYGINYDRQLRGEMLKTVHGIILHCIPQMHSVTAIPGAKVPIVKFRHDMSRFECDLSIFLSYGTSRGSLAMAASEMLYIMGVADERFRPLTFALRLWAKGNGITKDTDGPTPHITNFQMALLALHFLQMKHILPEVQAVLKPLPETGCGYAYGENYSYVSDYLSIPKSDNQQSLGELLEEFFQYYATFDFTSHAISVISRGKLDNTDNLPLHIVNPQETDLNVSKNVTSKELRKLQQMCRVSADILGAREKPSLRHILIGDK